MHVYFALQQLVQSIHNIINTTVIIVTPVNRNIYVNSTAFRMITYILQTYTFTVFVVILECEKQANMIFPNSAMKSAKSSGKIFTCKIIDFT